MFFQDYLLTVWSLLSTVSMYIGRFSISVFCRCCSSMTRAMVYTMSTQSHWILFLRIKVLKFQSLFSCGLTQAGKTAMLYVEEVKRKMYKCTPRDTYVKVYMCIHNTYMCAHNIHTVYSVCGFLSVYLSI